MNELQTIHTQEILERHFAVYGTLDDPLFLAKDVAQWIEHSNTSVMLNAIDEEEKGLNIVYTHGGPQEMWFLTEDGLYEVLMQSRKPIAKQFKKKVKAILKEIRTNGGYIPTDDDDDDATIMAKALLIANKKIENKNKQITEQRQLIEEQKPKVIFADAVAASHTTILVRELAKLISQNGIKIGEKILFLWLRENGYLIKKIGADYNTPTQRSMNLKLFEIKESVINRSEGIQITRTPKVTGKGQTYFINKFIEEQQVKEA